METNVEIMSDGRTVWVNGLHGDCLGRFSRYGIDIHRTVEEQMNGSGQCLDCTHAKPTAADWDHFVRVMLEVYQVIITDEHRPTWLQP